MRDTPVQDDLFLTLDNPYPTGSQHATRYEEMRAEAIEYHRRHPEVWALLCRFAFEKIRRGFKKYGIGSVFERIRWETDQAQGDPNKHFKANNNHRSFYSREFMATFPEHDGFFRKRHQKSKDRPATGLAPLGPSSFPYEQ